MVPGANARCSPEELAAARAGHMRKPEARERSVEAARCNREPIRVAGHEGRAPAWCDPRPRQARDLA
jgi:hypothetical protein